MREVAKRRQDDLGRVKDQIRRTYDYFKPNYDRFNEFRKFVFDSSLKSEEITLLTTIGKPQLEFNVLEAYISRLLGEFSKQEPSLEVSADDPETADPQTIQVVDQHIRHILFDSSNNHAKYEVYKDLLSGGFSCFKVWTDYANNKSFKQVIKFDRAFDPTMCGFDQLARYSHKGDGRFCFELFPKSKEEFEEEYPDVDIDSVSFRRDLGGFNWSYLNDNTEILIVADYYEKKKRKVKIVQTTEGKVMTMAEYNAMAEGWQDFSMPPGIVGQPRMSEMETICRYRVIENQVLEYTETDFTYFPLIFVDGNSVMIKTPKNGNIRQMTRPYVYHAKGAQRLKNYAGISLANEIENTVQHKFMVAKEALPKEEVFMQAYKDTQKANVLVFNALFEQDPDKPIPNPIREVNKVPAPPEIIQAFTGSDALIQNVLGSYDASLGINNNQLSGIAIVEAASQSNAAAMPYIVGFLQGLQRVGECFIDLIPKYYATPRTIPVLDSEGKRSYVRINQQGGVPLDYDENALNIKVEAGASFQVQKSRSLQQIIAMCQASPLFNEFVNSKMLTTLVDNMDIRGIDQMRIAAEDFMKEYQQKQAQAQQMQQQAAQNNPAMMRNQIEMQKLMHDKQKDDKQFQIDVAKLHQESIKVAADLQESKEEARIEALKAHAEMFSKTAELDLAHKDMAHKHLKEAVELHHTIKNMEQGARA